MQVATAVGQVRGQSERHDPDVERVGQRDDVDHVDVCDQFERAPFADPDDLGFLGARRAVAVRQFLRSCVAHFERFQPLLSVLGTSWADPIVHSRQWGSVCKRATRA